MKKRNNFKPILNKFLFLAVTVVAVISGSTCEVGLGRAIGVTKPETSVNQLVSDKITPIKGSFTLSGKAEDDDGVESVKIKFKKSNGAFLEENGSVKEYTATLSDPGYSETDWSVAIENEQKKNPDGTYKFIDTRGLVKDYPIPDGLYTIVVYTEDRSGNIVANEMDYKIDNTPPVLIIDSPSTKAKKDKWADGSHITLGSELKIKGQLGDANEVKNIKMTGYNAYTSLPSPRPKVEIPAKSLAGSKDINLTIVKVEGDDPSAGKYGELLNLQKHDEGGTDKPNNIIADFIVTDTAQKSGASEGNTNTFFYLRDDLRKKMKDKGYTAQTIYDFFSGKKDANNSELTELWADSEMQDLLKNKK